MHWTCPKCSFSLEIDESQEVCFCPNCGTKATIELRSTDETAEASDPNIEVPSNTTCPICCCEITQGDEHVICPDCGTIYHKDCWDDNKGCATYGCKSAQCLDVHLNQDAVGQDFVPCPWCHTLLSPKTVICSACGRRTDQVATKSFSFEDFKQNALIPIGNNLLLLWQDVISAWKYVSPYLLYALRTYKGALFQYAHFQGVTNRTDFFCFFSVSAIIYLVLFLVPGNCYLALLYMAATMCPTLAAMVRRLRDTGLSAWFLLAIPVLPLLLWVPSKTQTES